MMVLLKLVFAVAMIFSCFCAEDLVIELTKDSFTDEMSTTDQFVMFFAPWCGHCKRLKPVWEQLAQDFSKDESLVIAKVDCTKFTDLCVDESIKGYPTLMYYSIRETGVGYRFTGARTPELLHQFITEQKQHTDNEDLVDITNGLYKLNQANFMIFGARGEVFIKFYAPWCGHCKKMEPAWRALAETYELDDRITIAEVDCTSDNKLCNEYEVRGYPALLYLSEGRLVEKYSGARDLENMKKFVERVVSRERLDLGDDGVLGQITTGDEKSTKTEPVVVMTEANAQSVLAERKWVFVKFYAPWCGHCKKLAPTWLKLGEDLLDNYQVNIVKVDCTQNKNYCQLAKIQGYPTLIMYKSGEPVAQYNGDRSLKDLTDFVHQHNSADKDEL